MKRTLALLLSIGLLLCFTACEKKPPVESEVSSAISSEESVSEPSTVESAEPSNVEQNTPSSDDTVTQASEPESMVSSVDESSASSIPSRLGGIPADPEDVTPEVKQNALKEFYNFVDSLRVENIGEIHVSMGNPGANHGEGSTNPEQIQKWLEMFRSIKIGQVEPYALLMGDCGSISFTIYDKQGNITDSFSIRNGTLDFDYTLTQLEVEEMDEDLLSSLLTEMGFPPGFAMGYGFW